MVPVRRVRNRVSALLVATIVALAGLASLASPGPSPAAAAGSLSLVGALHQTYGTFSNVGPTAAFSSPPLGEWVRRMPAVRSNITSHISSSQFP